MFLYYIKTIKKFFISAKNFFLLNLKIKKTSKRGLKLRKDLKFFSEILLKTIR